MLEAETGISLLGLIFTWEPEVHVLGKLIYFWGSKINSMIYKNLKWVPQNPYFNRVRITLEIQYFAKTISFDMPLYEIVFSFFFSKIEITCSGSKILMCVEPFSFHKILMMSCEQLAQSV